MDVEGFRSIVYRHYEDSGRSFPWRERITPWGVLVSEFMLQQTQTGRVAEYWERWMRRWPSPESLAAAPLEEVLREWNGLGYNRRARNLREAARVIAGEFSGRVPESPEKLRALPGVGPYSSGAIACFAYNYPAVFIETNIRSAVIHCFFSGDTPEGAPRPAVGDEALLPILKQALDRLNPRKWHYALMDYGAALKKSMTNPARRSAAYVKQSRFEGSFRQKRGRVLKSLAFEGPAGLPLLAERTGIAAEDLYEVVDALSREMMAASEDGIYRIR
ncbi:MAG: A/G-specific adenine glycosylase [Spirochaetaceae bacterium]|jgi:A/G-specific adenine glycosylase|nr:A/G-specific adenine glycosylase [Spirochaetaceae bacterium]